MDTFEGASQAVPVTPVVGGTVGEKGHPVPLGQLAREMINAEVEAPIRRRGRLRANQEDPPARAGGDGALWNGPPTRGQPRLGLHDGARQDLMT